MTALAFAGKCGFLGASGSVRSFAEASRASIEPRAIAPTPTPQSRKKCRRVRASVNALSISCGVMCVIAVWKASSARRAPVGEQILDPQQPQGDEPQNDDGDDQRGADE